MDPTQRRKGRAIALTETASGMGIVAADALQGALDRFLRAPDDGPFLGELVSARLVDERALEALLSGSAPTEDEAARPTHDLSTEDAPRTTAVVVLDRPSAQLLPGGTTVVKRPPAFDVPAQDAPTPPARYRHRGLLGKGGMGEVHEVKDVDLNRSVALKRVRPDRVDERSRAQFLQEAQITAQLEHPNIPPIHDIGRLQGGEPFFTMKRVEGTTLRTILARVQGGDRQLARKYDPMRLAIVFLQVAQAVAYAHARGVLHCDLKPENVLVGRHGEVLVMDWGLAHLFDPPASEEALPPVRLLGTEPQRAPGAGTLLFMAPEQLAGDVVDERSDVYALGAILYEVLAGGPPYDATSRAELLIRMFTEGPRPPRGRAVPAELEAIAMKALAPRPGERFQRVSEIVEAVEAYLTGARRRKNAELRFAEGEAARARRDAAKARRAALLVEKAALEETIKPYDDEARKRPLWAVEEQIAAAELDVERAAADALDAYGQAVSFDDAYDDAAARLADLHVELYVEAEERGDTRAAAIHRTQIERFHRGRRDDVLRPRGRVTIDPVDDDVVVSGVRLQAAGKRVVAGEAVAFPGAAPRDLELPAGSYLFTATRAGRRPVRLPILVGRGTTTTLRPRTFADDEIGDAFVPVAAGPFVYGGDADALNAGPRTVVDVPDFAIARFPTTCGEYLAFLNAVAEEDPARAATHVPRTKPDGGFLWERGEDGRYALPERDGDGNPVFADAPVMGVSFVDATAYAAWRARTDGAPIRLPTEIEWEKAARGADGRVFPWGDGFDPSFCKMALSRPGRPQPEPVGAFPVDASPYGMRDAAGGIREWCDAWFDAARETRVLRGGAWYFNAAYCRLAFRHGYLPHIVFTNFGIRLARTL